MLELSIVIVYRFVNTTNYVIVIATESRIVAPKNVTQRGQDDTGQPTITCRRSSTPVSRDFIGSTII